MAPGEVGAHHVHDTYKAERTIKPKNNWAAEPRLVYVTQEADTGGRTITKGARVPPDDKASGGGRIHW